MDWTVWRRSVMTALRRIADGSQDISWMTTPFECSGIPSVMEVTWHNNVLTPSVQLGDSVYFNALITKIVENAP
jgi:hypothetical protein